VPVAKRLEHGSVVPRLVELSRSADQVVLQHRHLTRMQRVFTGSVCSGVATRAKVPVVSVPELWADPGRVANVVVGIDDTTGNDALLERAFALAAERAADLTVLHAWFIPSMYDEVLLGSEAIIEAREVVRAQFHRQMDAFAAVYPTVQAHLEVSHVRPADALVEASRRSDLLLVGRRSAHTLAHLGPVARALVRESRCPVMVLPHSPHEAPGVREPLPEPVPLAVEDRPTLTPQEMNR
jgi:nucleotide-binding universal stress UspA family protein